jgi:hypothetical protein
MNRFSTANVKSGLIQFDRMGERRFVFEKCNPVNEKRFNYMSLPKIFTKNKRATGNIEFDRTTPRKELFPQKKQ